MLPRYREMPAWRAERREVAVDGCAWPAVRTDPPLRPPPLLNELTGLT